MGRSPCCSKKGLNRGAWSAQEDQLLTVYIKIHGKGRWRDLPKSAGLKRCGKSCRLRWLNYLRPGIKRGNISHAEEDLIIRLHKLLGNRWSLIAGRLPDRTDNEIKNYWNTTLSKKLRCHPTLLGETEKVKPNKSIDEPVSPIIVSNVVRTVAQRCNRVFLTPQPNTNRKVTLPESGSESPKVKAVESDSCNGLSSVNKVEEEDSANLVIDLGSSFFDLNSDLFDFGNGEAGEGSVGNSQEPLPSWDQTFLCFQEDWTRSDGIEPDFPSFTSLLNEAEGLLYNLMAWSSYLDSGLASLADMEAGSSGNHHHQLLLMKSSYFSALRRRVSYRALFSLALRSPRFYESSRLIRGASSAPFP
ncbi:hypothetical protein NE237_022313 [Protea cynaroides]|uniref:Uncharacterized protein n=1 Tax=Protea cynaroides TaxID=273540 RepID=A0A9Q0K3E6_9MAGN|nr:hypothetical protein NE237_022313 [Protea cynaroides]